MINLKLFFSFNSYFKVTWNTFRALKTSEIMPKVVFAHHILSQTCQVCQFYHGYCEILSTLMILMFSMATSRNLKDCFRLISGVWWKAQTANYKIPILSFWFTERDQSSPRWDGWGIGMIPWVKGWKKLQN